MTWVVGATSVFGAALMASDIQVSWSGGQRRDCLQKVYPLGDYLVGGCAGSVQIGFRMVFFLQRQLAEKPPNTAWNLEAISSTWLPRILRRLYKESPEAEKANGCELLIAAAHPTAVMGDLPYPQTVVFTFRSPDFKPEKARPTEAVAIGSGASAYAHALEGLTSSFPFHQLGLQGAEAQARHLAHTLYSTVKRNPQGGISRLFHAATVTRGRITIVPHELDEYGNDGTKTEVRFPPVARDYKAFLDLCHADGLVAESSLC